MTDPIPFVTILIAGACWLQVGLCLWLAWRNRNLPEVWISVIFVVVAAAIFPVAIGLTLKAAGLSFADIAAFRRR